MSWTNVMPKELSVKPLPLIVLTGLEIKHNAVHKEIWDGFNARSHTKYRYKLLDGDHEYPKAKNKRPTEFYIPKGILKTNWFHKHLYQVPSLVVVFFDLDWDEPNWKEKQMECATKIELVRQSLTDRNTRVILVLVQKHPSIPVDGDNLLARERYPALCAACQIKNNYLFLLHSEHLHGYIIKLEEDAFAEPTLTYFTLEIKAVKLKRDALIKVTQQYLLVRLAIKIAFFHEMKQDIFKALEHYKQAYLNVLDIRFYDSNILEIKTVAGFINYKLCQLFFEIKHPIDAIDQFRKHIDIFRIKVGPNELAFEHSAWLSKQFQLMGELFEDAINKGYLNAVQTQHPGFYFHSAANHAVQRRLNRKSFYPEASVPKTWTAENPSPVESLGSLEYYGQRPWRQCQQTMEILDQQREKEGIVCLQEMELGENLTPFITEMLNKAIVHFKIFNCKRMKQYLSVCMAEEYFMAKNYQESLNIYVKVLNDYKNEHWWPILTSIMCHALKCAFLVADITNYCLLCTEIIGKNILLPNEEKQALQTNLMRVLANEMPLGECHQIDTNLHSIEDALTRWQTELSKTPSGEQTTSETSLKVIPAHVGEMVPFIECKVRFTSVVFNLNEPCELIVYMRTNCVDSILFNKLYLRFNLAHYNEHCVLVNELGKDELLFVPNQIKEFRFKFLPHQQDVGKELEITSVNLELGSRDQRVLVMHWKGDCKNALYAENFTLNTFAKLNAINCLDSEKESIEWDYIANQSSTNIISRKSNVQFELEHKMPIFVNELYAIKLTIKNNENNAIENLKLSVSFKPNESDSADNSKSIRVWIGQIDKQTWQTQQTKPIANIQSKQQTTEMIYVQMSEAKSANMSISLTYEIEAKISKIVYGRTLSEQAVIELTSEHEKREHKLIRCTSVQEDQLKLEAIHPFKFDFHLLSMQMKPVEKVPVNQPFLIVCDIKNLAPYALKITSSQIRPSNLVKLDKDDEGQTESFLKGQVLKANEMATECFCVTIDNKQADEASELSTSTSSLLRSANLGEYLLEWRRKRIFTHQKEDNEDEDEEEEDEEKDNAEFNVLTKVDLPSVSYEPFPLVIEPKVPSSGCLNQAVQVAYRVHNRTANLIEAECNLDENEYFAISGKKMQKVQIMPNDSTDYTFSLFPMQAGYSKLPKFNLKLENMASLAGDQTKDKPSLISSISTSNLQQHSTSIGSFTTDYASKSSEFEEIIQSMIPSHLFIFPAKSDQLATL